MNVRAKELLDKAKAQQISVEEFMRELWMLSDGKSRAGIRYKGTELRPVRIYRARLFEDKSLPSKVSDLSYPPIAKAKVGRANPHGMQVFYASAGLPTTFVENKKVKAGDVVVASEWRCYALMKLQKVGFTEEANVDHEYESLLRELFCQPGSEYFQYSAAIADHLMSGDMLHGITYPSIQSENKSQNLALKKSFVDGAISFTHATAYRIDDVPKRHTYKVTEFDFATNVDGDLDWKGRRKNWVIREDGGELKMVSSGWGWDAYGLSGELVDPE